MTDDLLRRAEQQKAEKAEKAYTAQDIEVLEGLEPVRRRPAMYIGGTDENALHHLVAEVFDNAMDEAVSGHATRIEISLLADGAITISDNGRGIPIDPHPKFKDKSALEVILTTLHSGGKFGGKAYQTSGGLHGVGISVVNALSERTIIEVVREKILWQQEYSRGEPVTKLEKIKEVHNRRGTTVTFIPDQKIFGSRLRFRPSRLYKMVRSKAYLFKGVEIRWNCDPVLISDPSAVPEKDTLHFPNGLIDFLSSSLHDEATVTSAAFSGEVGFPENNGRVEWAIHWPVDDRQNFSHSYCNTIVTPLGGTHENGVRAAITKGLRDFGEMAGNKKAAQITADDAVGNASVILSAFIPEPEFQGQTKEKLVSAKATRLVDNAIRDRFDHWLSGNPEAANRLLDYIVEKAEDRLRRKARREVNRKTAVQKLRLPGKLADCTSNQPEGTEIYLVEGDSAGGSAKQARNRKTQAILPLRGKILNVASATREKIHANQEIQDMQLALGCGIGKQFSLDELRYDRVVIMTDADVDGAHIAALLMTFFYKEMPGLIDKGHLYLAQPPLYRLSQGANNYYAVDDDDKDRLVKELTKKSRANISIGRFKGLGEMTPAQLKETTMNPAKRTLLRVGIDWEQQDEAAERVEHLMGKKPEMRFRFIQEQTALKGEGLTEALDV